MSLFGLINAFVGLGAMTKDWLVETYKEPTALKKAEDSGSYFYLHNGKMKSTKTARACSRRTDPKTRHEILVDSRTGEVLEDLTTRSNIKHTNEARAEAKLKGWKFYKTYMFECPGIYNSDIYVNDDIPGRFFRRSGLAYVNGDPVIIFMDAEIVDKVGGGKTARTIFRGNNYDQYGRIISRNCK